MTKELEAFERVWEDCSRLDLDYVSKHNLMDDLREIKQALTPPTADEVVSGFPDDDIGSAARYFYCAKASKKDRDDGLGLRYQVITDNRGETLRKNTHPTVKPCELMQYLVRLIAPKGATILDPFMGSGSTGKAVMFENRERNADYKFIGIDMTEEYLPICEARIEFALNKYDCDFKQELQESKEKGQLNLFDMEENL